MDTERDLLLLRKRVIAHVEDRLDTVMLLFLTMTPDLGSRYVDFVDIRIRLLVLVHHFASFARAGGTARRRRDVTLTVGLRFRDCQRAGYRHDYGLTMTSNAFAIESGFVSSTITRFSRK